MRELFWVKRSIYTNNNELVIKISLDPDLFGFIDIPVSKRISVTNLKSHAKLEVNYLSEERNNYFFIDTIIRQKRLRLVDEFAGMNTYNYENLELVGDNCFIEYGGCGGFCCDSLKSLGIPDLVYDPKGFHKPR